MANRFTDGFTAGMEICEMFTSALQGAGSLLSLDGGCAGSSGHDGNPLQLHPPFVANLAFRQPLCSTLSGCLPVAPR